MSVANDTLGSKGRAEQRGAPPWVTDQPHHRALKGQVQTLAVRMERLCKRLHLPLRGPTRKHISCCYERTKIFIIITKTMTGSTKTAKNNDIFGIFKAFYEPKT